MSVYFTDKIGITIAGRGTAQFRPDMTVRDITDSIGEPYKVMRTSRQRIMMYLLDMTGKNNSNKDNLTRPLIIYIDKGRLSRIVDWTSDVHIDVVTDENTRARQFMISKYTNNK